MGEFQAEDTGSTVQARVRATNAMLSRSVLGELSVSIPGNGYDPRRVPLEPIVERVRMRALDANDVRMLPLAVEAGLHFLRVRRQAICVAQRDDHSCAGHIPWRASGAVLGARGLECVLRPRTRRPN